ncbi:MAG: DUF4956 domain-containing protein [Planctomycetia bacterium]|nr:DUF4956 domain-containing protein [Planctomycetia bacterium]
MPDWIFSDSATETATLATLAARLAAAIVCGLVVAAIYRATRGRERVAASFPGTLVMLCVLIAMVTQVIGQNVALAFSLVGALSIVRFRTVVQDTKDTAFVIFAVAVGMAIGAGQPLVAICGTVAAGSVAWMFHDRPDDRSGRGGQPFELTIRMAADAAAEPLVQDVLARHGATAEPAHCGTAKKGTALRTAYRLRLPSDTPPHGLVRDLTTIAGVQAVSLRRVARNA